VTDGQRLDRRTAHRWVRSIGKRAGLGVLHPHMLRAALIMAALDADVPPRDVQIAARHADHRTTTIYGRRRQNFDRRATYVVVAFVAGGWGQTEATRHLGGVSRLDVGARSGAADRGSWCNPSRPSGRTATDCWAA
jgi:hypothetical protein